MKRDGRGRRSDYGEEKVKNVWKRGEHRRERGGGIGDER